MTISKHPHDSDSGIEYQLGQLATTVTSLDHWLRGNGQEGVIAQHSRDISLIKQSLREREIWIRVLRAVAYSVGAGLAWLWGLIMGHSALAEWIRGILHNVGR